MTSERKVVVITGASRGVNTIPGMPCIHHDQYDTDGIRVERFTTAPKDAAQQLPLICVHGGCHASWSWQEHTPVYADAGYEVHALNWRGRGGSAAINDDSFVKMSIADVVDDIEKVARCLDTPPVLIAHSMGGLAAQLYASAHEVGALVLLTTVVPSNVGATPLNCPSPIWTRHGGRRLPTSLGKCFFWAWTTCRPHISARSSSQNRPCGSTRRRAGRLPSTRRNSPRLSLSCRVRSTF